MLPPKTQLCPYLCSIFHIGEVRLSSWHRMAAKCPIITSLFITEVKKGLFPPTSFSRDQFGSWVHPGTNHCSLGSWAHPETNHCSLEKDRFQPVRVHSWSWDGLLAATPGMSDIHRGNPNVLPRKGSKIVKGNN